MRNVVIAGLGTGLLLLSACGTMASHAVSGFKVQTVAPDSFILTARVYPRQSRDEVRREVLVRAAQETLARGYDWYVLKRSNLAESAPEPGAETAPADALGLRPYGRWGGRSFRRVPASRSPRPRDFQVQMFRGDKPAGAQGFVARAVIASLSPPPKVK
ncbi:MAG TPA: hypothetical protein VKI45_08495 [Allosphingosinicella sp.]|nr:hypothetical protein [Allosphingosinicella sp.]